MKEYHSVNYVQSRTDRQRELFPQFQSNWSWPLMSVWCWAEDCMELYPHFIFPMWCWSTEAQEQVLYNPTSCCILLYIYQIPKVSGVWGTSCGKTESAIAVNFYFNKCYCYRLFIDINAHKSSSYINASINISNGIQLD